MANKPVTLTDIDNPEWTDTDFARARPSSEILSPIVLAALLLCPDEQCAARSAAVCAIRKKS